MRGPVDTARNLSANRTFDAGELALRRDPITVCTFGRSGTHLIIDMVRRQFAAFANWKLPGQSSIALYVPLDEVAEASYPVWRVRRTLMNAPRTILRSHNWSGSMQKLGVDHPEFAAWLRDRAMNVVVVRNPVVAIPKLWTLTCQFRAQKGLAVSAEIDDFVFEQATRWVDQVTSVTGQPRTLTIRFEDALASPGTLIERLATFLGEAPRFAAPFLIPPHRNRLQTKIARLNPRPMSTHVLVQKDARRLYRMDWSMSRLKTLMDVAGRTMANFGYNFTGEVDSFGSPVRAIPTGMRDI